ncbi:uncharacterized protein BCR38DRAFT_417058 [Pseudomassariella vexata]|uniref:Uncharacterized protein n=1 Tax=Pseudomassariella vexata TaxID=1141098 RepID=A0A1Y2EJN8_9PEZI|nr:uncharacterized protein BCR38DRAFT_417058 [Pseudomassariella vexata]ORY71514.1 hypothetical protein BCR38DRAFT_417058 [Pseudomassariella vexata]
MHFIFLLVSSLLVRLSSSVVINMPEGMSEILFSIYESNADMVTYCKFTIKVKDGLKPNRIPFENVDYGGAANEKSYKVNGAYWVTSVILNFRNVAEGVWAFFGAGGHRILIYVVTFQ